MKDKPKRILYFDALRLMAIIAVILIHVVIAPPNIFKTNQFVWWLTLICKSSSNWAVPIFFMISGALLLKKDEPISAIFLKRIPKIVLPFLVWNLVYIYFDLKLFKTHTFIGDLINSISGQITYHLWFIYALVGLYIITPLLRLLIKNAQRKDIEYFLLLSFLVNTIHPIFERFTHIHIGIPLFFVQGYIIFFVLGYYLTHFDFSKKYRITMYFLAFLSIVLSDLGTYFDTARSGTNDYFFINHFLLTMVFPSIAIFLFFKNLKFPEDNIIARLGKKVDIGRICFGIYFSHVAVLGILEGGSLGYKFNSPITLLSILTTTTLTFIICFYSFFALELFQKYKLIKFISKFVY